MNELFERPITYLITRGDAEPSNFERKKNEILEVIRGACAAEISLVQIREKNLTAKMVFDLASEAAQITSASRTKLLINDRADIAHAANADGVHLPSNSLPAGVVLGAFPKNFIVGVSTHSLAAALEAVSQKADFITFGPVFETPGKSNPQGLGELSRICRLLKPFPIIALGGINESNSGIVLENGASGYAAIRYLNNEMLKVRGAM